MYAWEICNNGMIANEKNEKKKKKRKKKEKKRKCK